MITALLVGDTHLGFDLPARPRVERRRRGHDFQANYERALRAAIEHGVDLVLHAGDVFHRPDPRPALVDAAFAPLLRAAEAGCTVVVLPGNHERAILPMPLATLHPRVHLIDRPRALEVRVRGARVAIAGFPYARGVRARLPALLPRMPRADLALLLVHHCVEGSRVAGHVFRDAPDVIRRADLPEGVAAVLSGHVHRHQVLPGRPPVLYAGSVERTAYQERDEPKGCLELCFEPGDDGGLLLAWRFRELPARPMFERQLHARSAPALLALAEEATASTPRDAVLRLRVDAPEDVLATLTAARLQALAPPEMNVELSPARGSPRRSGPGSASRATSR